MMGCRAWVRGDGPGRGTGVLAAARSPWSGPAWFAWTIAVAVIAAFGLTPTVRAAPKAPSPAGTPAPAPSATPPQAPQSIAVPAGRAAKNPYVITLHGEIDEWSARSVQRRIAHAEAAGADVIIFDIDTPGGSGQAMLIIAGAIKKTALRTVAWVNPDAYSAGAVIALACGEIVVNDGAALGDALPIIIGLTGLQPLPDAEREKILGPIMADLVDSARKNGHDEIMVQGFIRRGVELWLVEHAKTGQRLFVTAEQYEQAVGKKPTRGTPRVASVTGPVSQAPAAAGPPPGSPAAPGEGAAAPSADEPARYIPASPNVSPDLAREVDQNLALRGRLTARPDLSAPEHAGQYREIEYVADGYGVLTFRAEELLRYRIAVDKVRDDADVRAFFGSQTLTRLNESWSERLARFLSLMPVKGFLLVVFLVALFVEMTHPGLVIPGVIAGVALVALVVPPILVNMSAWWTVAAILAGIILIASEIFLFTGLLVPGILGVILLFGGLIGAVLSGPGSIFSGAGGDGTYAVATLLISGLATAGGIWLAMKYLPSVPVFNRLVLRDGDPDEGGVSTIDPDAGGETLPVGTEGVSITPLRPAGRVQIGDKIHDVVADLGFIDAGRPVRVVAADRFRTMVEEVRPDRRADAAPSTGA